MSEEATLQSDCNKYLKRCNILYFHREKGRTHKRTNREDGLPDLLIWNKGKCIFIELKSKTGIQTPGQITWESRSSFANIPYYICRSFESFIEIMMVEKMT